MFLARNRILTVVVTLCLCIGRPLPSLAGDFDGNSLINAHDKSTFQDVLLGRTSDPAYLDIADVNQDGVVNGRDIGLFTQMMTFSGQNQSGGPQTNSGACCFESSEGSVFCVVIPEQHCESSGGTYFGAGSVCDDPNVGCTTPPPPPVACCLPDGTCIEAPPLTCVMMMGSPQGPFTNCDSTTCDAPAPTGACCRVVNDVTNTCFEITRERCEADNGVYQGDGVSCGSSDIPCAPPSVGACCDPDAELTPVTCFEVTEASCFNFFGGLFLGDNTTCDGGDACPQPETGACCVFSPLGTPFDCFDLTEAECAAQGGEYAGDGTSCADDGFACPSPPVGACCLQGPVLDPPCEVITEAQCAARTGLYNGDGSVCSPHPCPAPLVGACCVPPDFLTPPGTCIEFSEEACDGRGGIFHGNGIACSDLDLDVACPVPPIGACCAADFSVQPCIGMTAAMCDDFGGTYQGDGTVCTVNSSCP
ncbi:MAG: dockerin type I domain-containing protein [Phycisphaerales bacterium]|nr:dockerin type I domain-containing protein [Phycisphaerales bacterium]